MLGKTTYCPLICALTVLSIGITTEVVGQRDSAGCIGLSAASGVTGVSTAACTILILCLPCFAACVAGTSAAWVGTTIGAGQHCGKRRRRSLHGFNLLDSNKDGFLSLDDVLMGGNRGPLNRLSFFPRLIDIADRNGDGRISKEESKAISAELPKLIFNMIDLNGDGKVNLGELVEGGEMAGTKDMLTATQNAKMSLSQLDRNKNSVITLDELRTFIGKPKSSGK